MERLHFSILFGLLHYACVISTLQMYIIVFRADVIVDKTEQLLL